MSRVDSITLRKIAINAKKELDERASEERENSLRREQYWIQLYKSAINGNNSQVIPQLVEADIEYFIKMKFGAKEIYKREHSRDYISQKLKNNEDELKRIKEQSNSIMKYVEPQMDWFNLKLWLHANEDLASDCDFERWFGDDFKKINFSTIEELEEFIECIGVTKKMKKDLNVSIQLDELISVLLDVKTNLKQYAYELAIFTQRMKITESEKNISAQIELLKNNYDYLFQDEINYAHQISWKSEKINKNLVNKTNLFSKISLEYLCSSAGQKTLEELEEVNITIAKQGGTSIVLNSKLQDNAFTLSNKDHGLNIAFPSLFDFETVITILKYTFKKKELKDGGLSYTLAW